MMSRRKVLEFAAAAGVARAAVPFALAPEEAAAALDAPLDAAPVERDLGFRRYANDPYDPIGFAESVDGEDWPELVNHISPEAMADYTQHRDAMIDAMPILDALPFDHPWAKMDEAALSMWSMAWMAGVRAGAAYEHLRLALLTPIRVCPTCHGHGALWDGSPFRHRGGERAVCPDCGGRGTGPTPAPTLPLPVGATGERGAA